MSFNKKELVTLNRTLAVKIGPTVQKVSAFTGRFSYRSGDNITYTIHEIHFPDPVVINEIPLPQLHFKESAIVSTQEE